MCWYFCSSTAEAKHSLIQNHQHLWFAVCCYRHYDDFNIFFCFAVFWNNFQPRETVSKANIEFTGNVTGLLSAMLGKQTQNLSRANTKDIVQIHVFSHAQFLLVYVELMLEKGLMVLELLYLLPKKEVRGICLCTSR